MSGFNLLFENSEINSIVFVAFSFIFIAKMQQK